MAKGRKHTDGMVRDLERNRHAPIIRANIKERKTPPKLTKAINEKVNKLRKRKFL